MVCLEASEISTMSCISVAMATVYNHFNCFPGLTFSSQCCAVAGKSEMVVQTASMKAKAKVMGFFIGQMCLQ